MTGKNQMATSVADKIRWTAGVENYNTPSQPMDDDALQFLSLLHAAKVEVELSSHDVNRTRVVQSWVKGWWEKFEWGSVLKPPPLLLYPLVGDFWVYGTNTISVLMHSHGRTDYYVCVCVCVCVCAYMRDDDEWILASSLNTSTVVYDWMLLLRWKGLGDFSRDEAQSINKWLLITPSLFHEPWPRDLQQLYRERQYVTAKPKIREHNWLA